VVWDRFLRACRGEPVDVVPVWFMRQAGRYMQEYRELRTRHSMLELCHTPELAAEVTLQPVRALGVDAAILFADILLPLEPMGASFDFVAGEGPAFEHPVRNAADVARLRVVDPEESLAYVLEAVRLVRRELDGKTPLIGFAGAPFTLASYLVEGGKSTNFARTKGLMYREPAVWRQLLGKLAEVIRRYLQAQIAAGAEAVQLFDSWAGALSPEDYREFVLPHTREVLAALEPAGVPVIHFATGNAAWIELAREAGGTVIGVDWRIRIDDARRRLGAEVPVQGNLDPLLLQAPRELLARRVDEILERARGPGHVFNLGHGILPETSPDQVKFVVDRVHAWRG
jgi:uroporphyrinogen decarboxylase